MNFRDIARLRMVNQQLTHPDFTKSADLVQWMGCIQAQDFGAAKWAIGARIKGITHSEVESDYNEGNILRTHILRPTWHFVAREDIRWILKLTAGKVRTFCRNYYRRLGIEDADLKKSNKIFQKELKGGLQLTRTELKGFLTKEKIDTSDIRMGFLLMDAELDGILCSGKRKGKQFTYALLEDRAPSGKSFEAEDAVRELTKRYFQSRGPASLKDFCWWSGLSVKNALAGIEMNARKLICETIDGQEYWFFKPERIVKRDSIHFLPVYDEYAVGYHDRSAILDPEHHTSTGHGIFRPVIVHNGRIAGIWKKSEKKGRTIIEKEIFNSPGRLTAVSIKKAEKVYEQFLAG